MALGIARLFQPQELPTSAGVIYSLATTPPTNTLKNGRLRLTNTSAGAVTATLYVAASGTGSAAANCFLNAVSIGANESLDLDIPTMGAGDTLRGLASAANSITVHEMGGVIYS
jgi:hypothetical protein